MMGSMILAISVQASVVILLGPVNINTDAEEILIGSLASVAIVPVFWIYMSKKLQDILWKCLGFWILHFSKVFSRIFVFILLYLQLIKVLKTGKEKEKLCLSNVKIGLHVTIFTHIKVICPQPQQLFSSSIVYQQI